MSAKESMSKSALLKEIEQSWSALNKALDQLSESDLTGPRDGQGWSVKDHLVHLSAWERSVVFFLQGKPRHEGLGVEEDTYVNESEDEINAVIRQKWSHLSLADVLAQLRHTHEQLLVLLEALSDADLQRRYAHFLPDEPGSPPQRAARRVIYANTAHHFGEHLGWIQTLVLGRSKGTADPEGI